MTSVKSFDKGAQAGMKQVLTQYKKQCELMILILTRAVCWEKMLLGDCRGVCCGTLRLSHYVTPSHNKYKEEYFEIGLGDYKGAIVDKLNLYCKGQDIDNHSLVVKGLKSMCPIKVGSFIDHTLG